MERIFEPYRLTDGRKESRTDNRVLPKAGLNGFVWTFVQNSTLVILMNFCAKNPRLRQYPNRLAKCKIMRLFFLIALVWNNNVFGQNDQMKYDNALAVIDSVENSIALKLDTTVTYTVYGYHGEAIVHSFPIRISFDSSKFIICVIDLRNNELSKTSYWFSKRQFLAKRILDQSKPNEVALFLYPNDVEQAFIEAVLLIAKQGNVFQHLMPAKAI